MRPTPPGGPDRWFSTPPAHEWTLADWRRRVSELYAEVREIAVTDPIRAWNRWCAVRDGLYATHEESPVPSERRAAFAGRYWPYDAHLRFDVEIVSRAEAANPDVDDDHEVRRSAIRPTGVELPMSSGETLSFTPVGRVEVQLPDGPRTLDVYWMTGYAGGLFLPFRDATNGTSTYGAGRYLLDTAKGADLGGDIAQGRLILDFNFAFHPSCAFDPRWSCPLAPPENRLDVHIEAGERLG